MMITSSRIPNSSRPEIQRLALDVDINVYSDYLDHAGHLQQNSASSLNSLLNN